MNNLLSFASSITYIFYICLAVFVLLFMVTIHEAGHYIAGKKLGFKINEFSIGFGKAVFQKTRKNGEIFSIRIFPLGGYCAFAGEDEEGESVDDFNNKAPWKRLIVLFSGAFANFLSAIIFSFILLVSYGYDIPQVNSINSVFDFYSQLEYSDESIIAGDVVSSIYFGDKLIFESGDEFDASVFFNYDIGDSFVFNVNRLIDGESVLIEIDATLINNMISLQNQLTAEDAIYSINGTDLDFVNDDFIYNILPTLNIEDDVEIKVKRDGEYVLLTDVNLFLSMNTVGEISNSLGITINTYVYSFWEALLYCVPFTLKWCWKVLLILWSLITGGVALTSVGGPIATISVMATFTQASFAYLVLLLPLIATNLAVFNLIPFPALDGSRMVFVIIEWIRGKPVNRNVEAMINNLGLLFLLAFVLLVDILYLFV